MTASAWAWPPVALAVVFCTMAVEAWLAARNERALRTWGARAVPDDSYAWMRVLYPGGFLAVCLEGWWRGVQATPWAAAGLALFLAAKLLKYAAIRALGQRWSFRVFAVPGAPLITHGIYRYLRHPNYVAVAGELAGIALWMQAPITGTLFAVTFGAVLLRRIGIEERALGLAGSRTSPAAFPVPLPVLPRPWWVRMLDLVIAVTGVLFLSAVCTGGLRVRFDDVRITAESTWKLGAVLALLFAVRRAVWRQQSWLGLVRGRWRQVRADAGVRRALPWVLTTRLTVLYATYLAVAVIGYPQANPPFRASTGEFGNLLARWDAGWYLSIAERGYSRWGNPRAQSNVAFFPAYPMAMRATAALLGARWGSPEDPADGFRTFTERRHVRLLHAGWLVSVLAFTGSLVYLFRLARDMTGSEESAGAAVALLATYPFGFFYGAVYTEALFLLCATAGWYHFQRRQWAWAAVAGLVAGLARPNGCLLSVPLGLLALDAWRRDGYRWQTLAVALPAAACAGLGMLGFTWWLHSHTGEWFIWLRAHGAWGRQFSGIHMLFAQRWRDLQGLGLGPYTMVHAVEILNMAATFLVLGLSWPIARRYGWALAAFLLVTVLPPLFMGGFLSMGRVTATLFPVFVYLGARIGRDALPHVLLVTFGLQVALAVMHFTWRQVY